MSWDVIIAGGGPTGSTIAGILLRYQPSLRVLICERAAGPRYRIGESLVSEVNRVLAELGAYAAVAAAGFPPKVGATFLWGADPAPWHMIFGDMAGQSAGGVQTEQTWHVERSRYDDILLQHAVSLGAVLLREPVTALREAAGRVVGVTAGGQVRWGRMVVDATGQSGLCGSLADRELDPLLRHVALSAYVRRVRWIPSLNGSPAASMALISAHSRGWSWSFPIREELHSVGVVTGLGTPIGDPEAYLRAALAEAPGLREVMVDAALVPHLAGGATVRRFADFSSISRSIYQPGLVRAGDAAGFVDPILSVGVFLGQSLGRILAYALGSVLRGELTEARAMGAYAQQVRDTLTAFRELACFFYRFNDRREDWWAEARRLVAGTALSERADDAQAFLSFATGFAARHGVFREPTAIFDAPFFVDAFQHLRATTLPRPAPARVRSSDRLQPALPLQCTPSAVPVDGEGRMVAAVRICAGTGLHQRMLLPPSMAPLLGLLDGQRTVAQLSDAIAAAHSPVHRRAIHRYVRRVLAGLLARGMVRPAATD